MTMVERPQPRPRLLGLLLLAAACGRSSYDLVAVPGSSGATGFGTGSSSGSATAATSDDTGITSWGTSWTSSTGGDLPPTGCVSDFDCTSPDPCVVPTCVAGVCLDVPRDLDGDGDAPVECGGGDCNDLNPWTWSGALEDCFDADDNDCNGVADCLDPVCQDVPNCGCVPDPGGESCTNGSDDDCDTTVDCLDADCLGTPSCGCLPLDVCGNGIDDDCDGALDCDDGDCAATPTCACMGTVEQCDDLIDDDCDLLVDCIDPDCQGIFPCTCSGNPAPENCSNGADDDCDALPDCADPDCAGSPACSGCAPEVCDNGDDDDCDGKIDCADDACAFDPGCAATAELCNNGLDDDLDTLVDCEDPDCLAIPVCADKHWTCLTAELIAGSGTYTGTTAGSTGKHAGSCGGGAGEAVYYFVLSTPMQVLMDTIGTSFDSVLYVRAGDCGGGAEIGCDDDSGGAAWSSKLEFPLLLPGTYFVFVDGYTIDPFAGPNEGPYQLNITFNANPVELCANGKDDDGDVWADCADPDCTNTGSCGSCNGGAAAQPEFGAAACTNGKDDDCDGDVDCSDDDCSASDYYVTECCDGVDENDNGIPDDFNCRCHDDADCDGGQMCYTHTASACGFPCTAFFGDVCPFVAPGSACNAATNQCEF
jgi:hypothetical protein